MKLYKIKKSNIDKNGLYANYDIKVGTKIIEKEEKKSGQGFQSVTKFLKKMIICI